MRMGAPWFKKQPFIEADRDHSNSNAVVNQFPPLRPTKSEWQLKWDLDHLADSCVKLKLKLTQCKALVENLTTQEGDQDKKKLSSVVARLTNEKERMVHHAKTAVWKLQEVSTWCVISTIDKVLSHRLSFRKAACGKQAIDA